MSTFYIVPPRKTTGSIPFQESVASFNGFTGDIILGATGGLQIVPNPNGYFVISVVPNTFVLQGGDIYTGNLQFLPTSGGYGVRLWSSNADPTQHDLGGLYYNTSDNTLKIGTGTGWQTLAQTGALTQAQGDARYLELDGSNGPLTGDLSLGTSRLQLGSKASDPSSAAAGDLYFNTTSDTPRIFNGTSWADIGAGVTSVNVGAGIASTDGSVIVNNSTVSVDASYPFTWTGHQSFTQPISFATPQTFSIGQLYSPSQATGDMISFTGGTWQRLGIGTAGQILTVSSGVPTWSAGPSGSTVDIGTPTDTGGTGNPVTGYEEGFYQFTASTTIADAVEKLNEVIAQIAPAKAGYLTSAALSASNPTLYTAVLSAGLPTAWYQSGKSAGSTVTSYFTSGSYTLTSPSLSSSFRSGSASTPSTYGQLTHKRYNSSGSSTLDTVSETSYTGSPITSGALTLDSVAVYNSIWAKSNAHITYTQSTDGYEGHTLSHTEAGESNKSEYWLDTYSTGPNASPVFGSSPSVIEGTPVDKWLSGVKYYGQGTTLVVSFSAATGIFNRAYNATQVAMILCTASPNTPLSPSSVPTYTDFFDKTGGNAVLITLSQANQTSLSKTLSVTLYKANGNTVTALGTLARAVCTYGSPSTTTTDAFADEAQRLTNDETVMTAFNSMSTPLANGYAQARPLSLWYPVSSDYSGSPTFSGNQEYHRMFVKVSASNGTLTFGGLTATLTDISPYGTGLLNVLLWLETDQLYYDLGVAVNSAPAGTTRSTAKGGRFSYSGNQLVWSIGTNTTGPTGAGNHGRFRVIIIYRSTSARAMTSLASA